MSHILCWTLWGSSGTLRGMVIGGMEITTEVVRNIQALADTHPAVATRASLSRQVCQLLNLRSPNGRLQEVSCRVALKKLSDKGQLNLPRLTQSYRIHGPRRTLAKVPVPEISCELSELGRIEIVLIESRHTKDSVTWRALMDEYHYLRGGSLCGAQLRYLIRSEKFGWLGGLSFSASAWHLTDRDRFIGWNMAARNENRQRIVCNSRFLIVPSVRVPNLASHVLSRCLARLQDDWEKRYNYRPVLVETFVELERFKGTCYRAANWIEIGKTAARGRQDPTRSGNQIKKAIFVFPLQCDWRAVLCRSKLPTAAPEPQPTQDWATQEFEHATVHDKRIKARAAQIVRDFMARPGMNLPAACDSRAKTKAAYRLMENEKVDLDQLLHGHIAQSIKRCGEHKIVLAPQDTTTLNYTGLAKTTGLGPIGIKKDKSVGVIVHHMQAFTEDGLPLGMLHANCWARDPAQAGKREKRKELPIEKKESFKWIAAYRDLVEAQKRCPSTRLISLGDRESDIYEYFKEVLSSPDNPAVVVRGERTRLRKVEDEYLWEFLCRQPLATEIEVQVPRRADKSARKARVETRFARVVLKPPMGWKKDAPLEIWAVYLKEVGEIAEPIEWMLLTTVPILTVEDALRVVRWYVQRWKIEVYHRVLKSGCKVEERQMEDLQHLENCLALDLIVAWRVLSLTLQGRETPNVPCTVFFQEAEWKALLVARTGKAEVSSEPPTLGAMITMIAMMGGYLNRKSDGPPGSITIWRGLRRLDAYTEVYLVFRPNSEKPAVSGINSG